MCILQTKTYWKVGTPWDWNFKFLKCKSRAQREYEKNGVIRLVMFTLRVMVIKMSKIVHFMNLLLNTAKISLGKVFNCIWKVLFSRFREYYGLCSSELPLAKRYYYNISRTVKSKSYELYPSLQELVKIFHMYLNIVPKLWQIVFSYQQKILKNSHFDILKTIPLAVNMITRQMTPFFSSTLWDLSIGMFHFKTYKIQFHGSFLLCSSLVCKIHICMLKKTFSRLLT